MEPRSGKVEPSVALLLAVLEGGTQEWLEELGEVSDAEIVWQPFPGGHSVGALILHIADVEAHWLHEVAAGAARTPGEAATLLSEETDQYAIRWPAPPRQPLAWYLAQRAAVRARTLELVAALTDLERVSVRGEEEFTLRWLLSHVIQHESYHGGQAVLLALLQRKMAG